MDIHAIITTYICNYFHLSLKYIKAY